jgi:hypothetical protein
VGAIESPEGTPRKRRWMTVASSVVSFTCCGSMSVGTARLDTARTMIYNRSTGGATRPLGRIRHPRRTGVELPDDLSIHRSVHHLPWRKRGVPRPLALAWWSNHQKIHALTDACGRAWPPSARQPRRHLEAPALLDNASAPARLLADKVMTRNNLRESSRDHKKTEHNLTRSRKAPIPYDAEAARDRK